MRIFDFRFLNDKKRTPAFMFAGVLLLSDQVVKYFFMESEWCYCNPVGSWGMAADNGVLIVVMIAILTGVGYWIWRQGCCSPEERTSRNFNKRKAALEQLALIFIFSSGLSNLVDRIVFGCVRDFSFIPWFPAFNPADAFLTLGAALLLFVMFAEKK